MTNDKQPFLPVNQNDPDVDGSNYVDDEIRPPQKRRACFTRVRAYWMHAALLLVNIAILVTSIHNYTARCAGPELVYSPARHVRQYQRKQFDEHPKDSPFSGLPRPEHDSAWHDLLQPTALRVSAEDLAHVNGSSIELKEGGYIVGLGVYHELHCLKKIRQSLHPEYYFANETAEEADKRWWHTDHCLEMLRSATMCRSDISMYLFEWKHDVTKPSPKGTNEHDCVNFEAIDAWARPRAVRPDRDTIRLQGELLH